MDVQLAVGRQAHDAVEAAAAPGVERLADAEARDLRAALLAAALLASFPIERGRTALERFALIRARDGALLRVVFRGVVGRVDAADRDAIEVQRFGGLVDQRLDRGGDLVLPGAALRSRRRRVRADLDAAITHRRRLIEQRDRTGRGAEVAAAAIGPVLLHDREIGGRDA